MTTSEDILKIHKNKIPVIIQLSEQCDIDLDRLKYIVPRDITIQQFHCILKKYIKTNEKQSIILFINNVLPICSESVGSIYNQHKDKDKDCMPSPTTKMSIASTPSPHVSGSDAMTTTSFTSLTCTKQAASSRTTHQEVGNDVDVVVINRSRSSDQTLTRWSPQALATRRETTPPATSSSVFGVLG